jgi:hypothetical protein
MQDDVKERNGAIVESIVPLCWVTFSGPNSGLTTRWCSVEGTTFSAKHKAGKSTTHTSAINSSADLAMCVLCWAARGKMTTRELRRLPVIGARPWSPRIYVDNAHKAGRKEKQTKKKPEKNKRQ